MIRGRVNSNWEAWTAVELLDKEGLFRAIDVVLDTGFTGDLLLTSDVIEQLEVSEAVEAEAILDDGQDVMLSSWRGRALWHDGPVSVLILEADGDPLLGINLLRGSRVTLDVLVAGDVTIDELSPYREAPDKRISTGDLCRYPPPVSSLNVRTCRHFYNLLPKMLCDSRVNIKAQWYHTAPSGPGTPA